MSEPLVFAFTLVDTGAVLFLLVYFVITLSDLECDYLNAQQCCSKLNMWVIPKLLAHTVVVLLFLLYGWWILALTNLPMVIWMLYEYLTVPSGNTGVYDPTEIHNRGQLKRHMRDCMVYLCWYLIMYLTVPSGNTGVYDPTEIHNRGQLKRHMRDCMISLGWYLITFFIYLYCMIIALLKDNPLEKDMSHFSEDQVADSEF